VGPRSSFAARQCTRRNVFLDVSLLTSSVAADNRTMLPTWVFQKGCNQLMLHCRETPRGVTLVVSGDDDLRSYSFHDFAALAKFESEMADFLIGTGWTPARLTVSPSPAPSLPARPNPGTDRPGQRS
jgi:hypothetical protein